MSVLKNKNVKTRKLQQCFACCRIFKPGTKMNYFVSIYEGEFSAVYSCMSCVEIMNRLQSDEGYPGGFVGDMLKKGQTPEELLKEWDNE